MSDERAKRLLELSEFYEVQRERTRLGLPMESIPAPSNEFMSLHERQDDVFEILHKIVVNNGEAGRRAVALILGEDYINTHKRK